MNILLINPNLSTSERYGKALGKVGPTTEPLGLAYLAASILESRNDDVEILDATVENYNENDLKTHLLKKHYDTVGITMLTPMYVRTIETAKIVRQTLPNSTILVGGPHPTIFPEQTLKDNKEIDIVLYGEAENTIINLLNALEKNISLDKINGIVFRKKNKIKKTKPQLIIKDIDKLPLPARHLLKLKKYKPAPTYYKKLPSYIMLTSRGCPYRCVYCSKIMGNMYRHHSVDRIIKEMKILIEEYNAKEIIFRDDTFGINRDHAINLCQEIINQKLNKKIKWTCMTRANLVDFELLKLMKKAGCWSIHYGIESGSQRLLDLIQKDITLEQAKNAIKWTKQVGIETKAFFMLGLPTETREESLQTLEFTKELNSDWIQVTITVPYPGTKLYELAQKDGTLRSLNWEDYQTWAGWSDKELIYLPNNRNAEEIKELQTRAMRKFYLTPKFILKQVINLKSFENIKTYFNGGVALIKSKIK